MHRELVERRRWISEERFLHALNFCMLLPGPEAQQLATYIGWLKHRTLGGVAAGALFVLPGFIIITVISFLYVKFSSLAPLQGVLFGLKAAVLAIVLEAVVRIARRALTRRLHWIIAAAAFFGIYVFGVSFPVIVAAAAVVGFVLARRNRVSPPVPVRADPVEAISMVRSPLTSSGRTEKSSSRFSQPRSTGALRVLIVCLTLWFAPLLLLYATLGAGHVITLEGVFFSKMAVVTFGGAYAALAYVAQETVQRYQWLSADDMMQGLALAETTPGPLILVLTFVGFVAAFRDAAPFDPLTAGLLGAALTTWVTFVPCFLWILLGAPHLERIRQNEALSAALASVTAAVVGVILNLGVWFGLHALFGEVRTSERLHMQAPIPVLDSVDWAAVAIAAAAMVALLRFKAPMVPTLGAAALAGVLTRMV
jgi:chromate transporter